jgi:hypothetical protein
MLFRFLCKKCKKLTDHKARVYNFECCECGALQKVSLRFIRYPGPNNGDYGVKNNIKRPVDRFE